MTTPTGAGPAWYEVRVALAPAEEEAALARLLPVFPQGVAEWEGDGRLEVAGYVQGPPRAEVWRALRALRPLGLRIRRLPEGDFLARFRAHWRRREVVPGVFVAPSDAERRPGDLVIEPGLAFGTGDHVTTRQCLEALRRHVRPGWRAADVGTGTGILALALARLGADPVVAYDVDPDAVRAAADHARRSGLAIDVRLGTIDRRDGPFDLVTANITADVLLGLADELVGSLAPGGVLILAGVIEGRQAEVRAAFGARGGLRLVAEDAREGWCALVFTTPASSGPGVGRAGTGEGGRPGE